MRYFRCVGLFSVLIESECRPLRRRAASTARPALVCMRFMKPCTRLRGMRFGWYVLFGTGSLLFRSSHPHDSVASPALAMEKPSRNAPGAGRRPTAMIRLSGSACQN
jgi:hypothetical protein